MSIRLYGQFPVRLGKLKKTAKTPRPPRKKGKKEKIHQTPFKKKTDRIKQTRKGSNHKSFIANILAIFLASLASWR